MSHPDEPKFVPHNPTGWFRINWRVDVEAPTAREAWLKAAKLILERAQEMQDEELPIVQWEAFDYAPRPTMAIIPRPQRAKKSGKREQT